MFLNRTEDTLLVANSGGTNISYVNIGATVPVEDRDRRLRTPNAVLYEITENLEEDKLRYSGVFFDFSDRPQFVVQDVTGRLLYSTVPTPAARDGTIRVVDADPVPGRSDDIPEVRLLFTVDAVKTGVEGKTAIAHIDSIFIVVGGVQDLIVLYDHVYGFPEQVIQGGPAPLADAIQELAAKGSDIFALTGQWDLREVGMSDTTFLAASGDRRRVAFGEGAVAPFGRIIMWDAQLADISNRVEVRDLISNAAERVKGIGLNRDGSLGVARGQQAAYFFTPNLRLQGVFRGPLQGGGAGAALHPNHASPNDPVPSGTAFVGTANRSIQIIDTFHFFGIREIAIRDNIAGPLRTSRALPSDNVGLSCPGDPNCVVVKLYGITDGGGVVVVNVRARDLQ